MPDRTRRNVARARALRADMTPAENALWRELRRQRALHWRRQTPLHGYIADFACLRAKLLVEVDGAAHDHPAAERRDTTRTHLLHSHGFKVHRVTNAEVLHDPARVALHLSQLALTRIHSPSPTAEGGVGGGGPIDRSSTFARARADLPTASGQPTVPPPPTPPPTSSEEGRHFRAKPSRKRRHALHESADSPGHTDPAHLILVGAITGAFGVRGEVRVRCFTAAPEGVASYGPLFDKQGQKVLTPKRWREVKDGLALTGPEITTREQAEALKGTALHVPRDRLPPPDDEEFYHVDLIGCRVESIDGAHLGDVLAVHDFGAGDVLELRTPEGAQRYIEFSRAEVPVVDLANRRLVATPIDAND